MRSLCRLPVAKNHNFGQIFTFWGLLYHLPFTDDCQIWCAIADPRCTLTCQISSRSVYSVALCWRKPPIFAAFGLHHLVLSPIANSLRKLNTGANLPISNGIKIVSVLQRLHGKIGRTLSDVQKRDEQTNRQTNKKTQRFWPPRRRVKCAPH